MGAFLGGGGSFCVSKDRVFGVLELLTDICKPPNTGHIGHNCFQVLAMNCDFNL